MNEPDNDMLENILKDTLGEIANYIDDMNKITNRNIEISQKMLKEERKMLESFATLRDEMKTKEGREAVEEMSAKLYKEVRQLEDSIKQMEKLLKK